MIVNRVKCIRVETVLIRGLKSFFHFQAEDLEPQPLRLFDLAEVHCDLDFKPDH